MKEETLARIDAATEGLPKRWREVLHQTLLEGEFETEAHRLLESARTVHEEPPPDMETAESILAGDAFIPMAVQVLAEAGVSLKEIDAILLSAVEKLKK
ncbi:hypothetical protein CSA37_00230 [Candidatus Fermentibacteria bacterium]|nr:MAG: hypothetical protein CSA37_00230 [Candidatus Fermentibacteria bacterium]